MLNVESQRFSARGFGWGLLATIIFVAGPGLPVYSRARNRASQNSALQSSTDVKAGAETDLQLGIALTQRGSFGEAIPHFLAAKGRVSNEYAVDFNLALCYIGTGEFETAIRALAALRAGPHEGAGVENLLAQAYAGNGQAREAFDALQRAVAFTPTDEKVFLFVADAFLRHQENAQSLQVIELGLQHVPDSPRLHYQRGYLLSVLDDLDGAKADFELAMRLAPRSEIAYLAEAQEDFLAGNLREAVGVSRKASAEGKQDYQLQTILGEALIRGGASPGQAEFAEARAALEKSVATRPHYASSQIALGHVELLDARVDAAIEHLETGRRLSPRNPAVYSLLATAYRKSGRFEEAEAMLTILRKLNLEQAQRIRTAPGEPKAIPGASGARAAEKKPPTEE